MDNKTSEKARQISLSRTQTKDQSLTKQDLLFELTELSAALAIGFAFAAYIPVVRGEKIISLYQLGRTHPIWGLTLTYSFLTLLYLPKKSLDGKLRPLIVLSGSIAGIISYIYGIYHYGLYPWLAKASFWGHAAKIAHILFFLACLIITWFAFTALWASKKSTPTSHY